MLKNRFSYTKYVNATRHTIYLCKNLILMLPIKLITPFKQLMFKGFHIYASHFRKDDSFLSIHDDTVVRS